MSKGPIVVLLGTALSVAASGLAFAADIAVKAPLPAPAPVFTWTGFYVGLSAGYNRSRDNVDPVGTVAFTDGSAASASTAAAQIAAIPSALSTNEKGFIGGGQIGWNWQWYQFVDLDLAREHGVTLKFITLADTMAWATPLAIKRVVGSLRERWPELDIALHLHDTRGMAIANAYAGLEMGVKRFDASVAGLGGCPFAGHQGAAGNVCTEDLVFLCDELGIETGIDLDALIECARLAEDVVGHPLPGSVMKGGTLERFRK